MTTTTLRRVPPEALFVVAGVSMYAGAAVAVTAFEYLDAPGVAWWRVLFAGLVLTVVRRSWRGTWTRRQVLLAVAFGSVLAAMNLNFYFAIDRLPLGTTVAIEFAGPVAVAALGARTRRSIAALALTAAGVVVLADVSLDVSVTGVVFALVAAVLWAGYVVLGARVATGARAVDGLGIGMLAGALVIAPVGLPPALQLGDAPWVLLLAAVTALASNVVPYGIDQVVLQRIPRDRFALLLALLPVTATVTGLVALRQTPGGLELAGITLVVAGIALSERPPETPVEAA
ncbi:MAG: EamA family transporter [Acidimicrobiia bacterium]|nr:EamA family transporter [Acidimicrobiia bacterium]